MLYNIEGPPELDGLSQEDVFNMFRFLDQLILITGKNVKHPPPTMISLDLSPALSLASFSAYNLDLYTNKVWGFSLYANDEATPLFQQFLKDSTKPLLISKIVADSWQQGQENETK